MTTLLGSTRRAVAAALLAVAPLPIVAQQPTAAELLTVREIDDLTRPIAQLSDEALEQVLRLLAERPAWAIAMGRAYRQQPGDVRAAIENQRRVAVVTVPVLSPMPAPAPVVQPPPSVVTPPTVIGQPAPVVVQQPTIIVPNPVFAPPPVIVHAPPIVHVRPWTFWPWTRTIVERPIYTDRRRERRDDDRGRERDDRRRVATVTPDRPRTAVPRSSGARTP